MFKPIQRVCNSLVNFALLIPDDVLAYMDYLKSLLILALVSLTLAINSHAQNYVFAQLTGVPVNTSGWNLQGGARIANVTGTNNTEILVCPVSSASGAICYNQRINLSLCSKWKAEFDFRLADGTGADGLAFCFLDVPPSGFVSGAGLGIPSSANGLKVCFDTWNNCIPFNPSTVHQEMPKIELRWGPGYDECNNLPTRTNADGKLSFITSGAYNHATITYNNGDISVFVNDSLYLTGQQQFNYAGYLGFTASNGGYNDNHSIKNVVIYTEMPPSEAGNAVTICPNGTAQLGAPANADYVYTWSPAAGLTAANLSNPGVQLNNTTATTQSNVFYVRTSFKTNPGCSSTDSVIVKVYPEPVINFIRPHICLNDAIALFTDSSYSGEPTLLPLTYRWNFGDPNATNANPNISNAMNGAHKYSAAANYNVQLTVTNNAGCTDSVTKVFTVNGAIPKAGFTVTNTSPLCSNKSILVQDGSSVDFGSITRVDISWGDSAIIYTDINPAPGKVYPHFYPLVQANAVQQYSIRYKVYSGITCTDEIFKIVSVLRSPKVIFNAVPSLCGNDEPYAITQAAEVNGMSGVFNYFGNGISSTGVLDAKQAGSGTQAYTATFIAANTCEDSAMQQVIIWPVPTANAGPDLFMLQGGQISINASATGNNLQYLWTPSAYLNNSKILQPTASPIADIFYQLQVTAEGGCVISDSVFITVLKDPAIPNAFSPNGDGINDDWQIRYLNTYPGCTVDVFDRFGAQVFHSKGYPTPWNGTSKGKPLPVAVYYYIVNTQKHPKPFTGSVTIVK